MKATSRPLRTLPAGVRCCWRCGVEFEAHARLKPEAPCRDCRDALPKPAEGWAVKNKPKERILMDNTTNYLARETGKLLLAIADGDQAEEVRLMRELTESVGVLAMLESMASVAIESMKMVLPDDWRGALNMAILDAD